MSWEEEFNQALASFGSTTPLPIEYRLHYDEFGRIYSTSMMDHPDSQQYLVVDRDTYYNFQKYTVDVAKKKLKKVVFDHGVRVQLKSSTQGYAVVHHHAGLILEADETYPDLEYYEPNS
jgi:hypothetical protein